MQEASEDKPVDEIKQFYPKSYFSEYHRYYELGDKNFSRKIFEADYGKGLQLYQWFIYDINKKCFAVAKSHLTRREKYALERYCQCNYHSKILWFKLSKILTFIIYTLDTVAVQYLIWIVFPNFRFSDKIHPLISLLLLIKLTWKLYKLTILRLDKDCILSKFATQKCINECRRHLLNKSFERFYLDKK